ncbi:MAG: phenylalanine 4-monooxygenase, partial [Myxococcaceae bacterium]
GGEVIALRGTLAGRELTLPSMARLYLTERLPSVAGGPADPGTWDEWFGELDAFTAGDGEAQARERKAQALPPSLAALYTEVRRIREAGQLAPERLEQIARASTDFPSDWLLRAEVAELRGEVPARREAAHA